MLSDIRLEECLWVRSNNTERQNCCRPVIRSVEKRGIKAWKLENTSPAEIQRLRDQVWKSDQHVILQGLLPRELNAIRPVFERRKNFSIMPVDWWVSPFWFSQHATFNIFHNYNGIMVRSGRAPFLTGDPPPWLMIPNRLITYEIQSALLRPAALLTAPLVNLYKWRQRAVAAASTTRFVYFPSPISEEDVPLHSEPPEYDFTNVSAIIGPWLMRDPYAPAGLNFANLYADRRRLIDLIVKFNGQPFKVYDNRQHNNVFLNWEKYTRLIRSTRFMVCTGGLHHNSIVKILEYTCLGVPMIGTSLPFEYPWLDQCMINVNPMRITPEELKPRLVEAVANYPVIRQNCLNVRESLLKLYNPDTVWKLLQDQMDGQPVPPGYLKESVTG